MKTILDIWWSKGAKSFTIINYKKSWKEVGNKPRLRFHHNGAKRANGDSCLDISLIIGYTIFNYTNFNLQRKKW